MELMKISEENKVFVQYIFFFLSYEEVKQRRMVECSKKVLRLLP
jgi:hypothetical protein